MNVGLPRHDGYVPPLDSYRVRLLSELDLLASRYVDVLDVSSIGAHNWDQGFIGFPHFFWVESSPDVQVRRMQMLAEVKDLETRIRLLFPHATPEVRRVLKESFGLLRRWVKRGTGDHSIPRSIEEAKVIALKSIEDVKGLADLLPADDWRVRLVVDTNTLLDNPDLAAHKSEVGPRYMVHLLPVVLGELDDLKRSGRTPELREAARKGGQAPERSSRQRGRADRRPRCGRHLRTLRAH